MQRVLVLGRGAAGKSTAARRPAELTGLPLIELDAAFWQPGLRPTPAEQWRARQHELTAQQDWIMDDDRGSSAAGGRVWREQASSVPDEAR